jgi:hypothetical protein
MLLVKVVSVTECTVDEFSQKYGRSLNSTVKNGYELRSKDGYLEWVPENKFDKFVSDGVIALQGHDSEESICDTSLIELRDVVDHDILVDEECNCEGKCDDCKCGH